MHDPQRYPRSRPRYRDVSPATVSGVVVFATLLLATVAFLLICVLLDRPHKTVDRQVEFLDGLRRISSRLGAESGSNRPGSSQPRQRRLAAATTAIPTATSTQQAACQKDEERHRVVAAKERFCGDMRSSRLDEVPLPRPPASRSRLPQDPSVAVTPRPVGFHDTSGAPRAGLLPGPSVAHAPCRERAPSR